MPISAFIHIVLLTSHKSINNSIEAYLLTVFLAQFGHHKDKMTMAFNDHFLNSYSMPCPFIISFLLFSQPTKAKAKYPLSK